MDEHGREAVCRTIGEIAGALREELGVAIDAHPGGVGVEAGQINRAFLAVARCLLGATGLGEERTPNLVILALHDVAQSRLLASGVPEAWARSLVDSEPGLGDRWLAYLALAPESVVRDLTRAG